LSFQGTGSLPTGRDVSAEEIMALLKLPAARDQQAGEAELETETHELETETCELETETLDSFHLKAEPVPVDITRFPFRATAFLEIFLENGQRFRGTAYFISYFRLATAGHNLLYHEGTVDHVDVIVDVNGSLTVGATRYTADTFDPHPEYFIGNRSRDFGVIRLVEEVGRAVGFFALDDEAAFNRTVNVTGYPEASFFQAASSGTIRDIDAARVFYDAATSRGQSGGPAYLPHDDPEQIVAVGIHTHGVPPGTFRSGVRMTAGVKSWLLSA